VNHEEIFEQAWAAPETTSVELPAIPVDDELANDRYLRVFIEVHLREDLGRELVRRPS
jgi:hypothetical protein